MRQIRLSGRESTVLKAIGFSLATPALEIQERTNLSTEDLVDVINALLGTGFVETTPYKEEVKEEDLPTLELEVNPSFVHELKAAMRTKS